MALPPTRNWVKIGALCEQSIRSSGESFYQGRIDDPSMSRPMDIALFAKEEGGYDIAWTRRRARQDAPDSGEPAVRSEEHTSELQSLMRISYAVFCLKKKKTDKKVANQYDSHAQRTY